MNDISVGICLPIKKSGDSIVYGYTKMGS